MSLEQTQRKQIVYVRAQDASGQLGPVTAVFLNIL